MSADEIIKTYLAIATAYLVMQILKMICKKDGVSGWARLKRDAEKKDLYMPEIFGVLAALVLLCSAATWPISLVRMVSRNRRNP